jgi:hypothetical protein
VNVGLERSVCFEMDAWKVEGGPLSPHLAVVGTYSPASFEGLVVLGVCHFEAWARRVDEIVMDLNYRMGPCGTVGSSGAVTATYRSKLSYINANDKRGEGEGSSANILYVRPIAEVMTTEVMNPHATYSVHVAEAAGLANGAPALTG